MLGFGLLVIVCRNPVSSALSLVISFLGLASLSSCILHRGHTNLVYRCGDGVIFIHYNALRYKSGKAQGLEFMQSEGL